MKQLNMMIAFAGVAIAGVVVAGCSAFGPRGADKVEADLLEQEIADYKNWQTPDWVSGFQETRHPVPAYVKYYVNDLGMSDIDNPPNGSIFVKEQFDADKRLMNFTVMKKIEGYDPENNDWYWAIAEDTGAVSYGGKLNSTLTSNCIDCHKRGDGGGDLLFIND